MRTMKRIQESEAPSDRSDKKMIETRMASNEEGLPTELRMSGIATRLPGVGIIQVAARTREHVTQRVVFKYNIRV